MIEIKNVFYIYKTKKRYCNALNNISFNIEENKINVLLGYSGSGKTTLLKILSGSIDDFSGDIFYDGVPYNKIDFKKLNLSYVTQEYVLYPHLTVFDNIAFPLKQLRLKPEEIYKRINEIAYYLDIEEILTRRPKHISKGQQQRVAIAKALVKMPKLLLMDEPFSNIDSQIRNEFNEVIKLLQKKYKMTIVYVTHDLNDAFFLADKIYLLDEGKFLLSGSPEEVRNSKNAVIKELLNVGN